MDRYHAFVVVALFVLLPSIILFMGAATLTIDAYDTNSVAIANLERERVTCEYEETCDVEALDADLEDLKQEQAEATAVWWPRFGWSVLGLLAAIGLVITSMVVGTRIGGKHWTCGHAWDYQKEEE